LRLGIFEEVCFQEFLPEILTTGVMMMSLYFAQITGAFGSSVPWAWCQHRAEHSMLPPERSSLKAGM
jgi:hypothetical protein